MIIDQFLEYEFINVLCPIFHYELTNYVIPTFLPNFLMHHSNLTFSRTAVQSRAKHLLCTELN
jgi:hypothetical protein